jgi:hypothetical protein
MEKIEITNQEIGQPVTGSGSRPINPVGTILEVILGKGGAVLIK